MCLFDEKLLGFKKSMRPRAKRSSKEPIIKTELILLHIDNDMQRVIIVVSDITGREKRALVLSINNYNNCHLAFSITDV